LISNHLDTFVSLRYGKHYSKIVPTYHQVKTEKTILNHLKKYMKGKRENPWYWDFKVHELDLWGIDLVDNEQPTENFKTILIEPKYAAIKNLWMGLLRDEDREAIMDVEERVVFHADDTMNIYYPFQGFIKNHLDPL
jgi:hypothetical protein